MTSLFYRERRLTFLFVAVILAAGLSAFLSIGRQEDPTITNLFATVVTPFPGAEPKRVEALVTERIEEELREIAEIDTLESVSRTGISLITVELSQFISDEKIEQAWTEIRDALDDASALFPEGAGEPNFDNDRTGAITAISAIVPAHDGVPLSIATRYAEALQDRLRTVTGTKTVELFGAAEEEILVTIDPDQVAALNLTPERVSAAIREADAKVRAGLVRGSENNLVIEVSGEIDSLARIREIPLLTDENGLVVRIRDVATLSKGVRAPEASIAFSNGNRAILVAPRMENDLQVDVWMGRINRELAAFEQTLPGGLQHTLLFDQSEYTFTRLTEVGTNLLIGVSLVVIVLFFTLGARSALIVASVLPIVSLGSIATLNFMGVTIHQMSVTGLIVALGLLVDAAIVMTDQIAKRTKAGDSRAHAVTFGIKRLAMPLLASTLTTALSFMPMALLPGPAGDFVGAIALAVIVMLFWSLIVALTITPALGGWILPDQPDNGRAAFWKSGINPGVIGRMFRASLKLSVRHPRLSILYALILPIIGFLSFPTLTAQFFPGVERDQFYIDVELPTGTAISRTGDVVRDIDAVLRGRDTIEDVTLVVGENAPQFYYNMLRNRDESPDFAQALIRTSSKEATAALIKPLQNELDAAFPTARILVRDLVQGPPVTAPVEIRFVGDDLPLLKQLGDEARLLMEGLDEITHARTSMGTAALKLEFALDEDKVNLAGLNLGEVARQLETHLEGVTGGSLLEDTEELPVRVRVGDGARGDLGFIETLDIISPQAGTLGDYHGIPLTNLGEMRVVPQESAINRRNGQRTNTVQGFVQYGVLPEEALAKFQSVLTENGFVMPAGVRMETGGDADARAETLTNLLSSVGLIVTLTIATIVLTFNSVRLSLVAFAVTILSAGLSFFALAVMQYPFGIMGVIGVIGSIGVSINAAIIILTALKADAVAKTGDQTRIVEIVMDSSRHIVSTTVTTFGGFLPLILEGGGFWPPFAVAIAGGVLLSTVISFYFTPPMFKLIYARAHREEELGATTDTRSRKRADEPAALTTRDEQPSFPLAAE